MYREALSLFVLMGRKGGKVWMLVVAATTNPPRLSLWLRYLQAALQASPSLAVFHNTPSPMAGFFAGGGVILWIFLWGGGGLFLWWLGVLMLWMRWLRRLRWRGNLAD